MYQLRAFGAPFRVRGLLRGFLIRFKLIFNFLQLAFFNRTVGSVHAAPGVFGIHRIDMNARSLCVYWNDNVAHADSAFVGGVLEMPRRNRIGANFEEDFARSSPRWEQWCRVCSFRSVERRLPIK